MLEVRMPVGFCITEVFKQIATLYSFQSQVQQLTYAITGNVQQKPSTSHPNHSQHPLVMLVVVSGAPVPCYADRVWPNPLHVVCGPTRQRWRDGFNLWASSTLQCSSGFNSFKFVKRQFIWRIFLTSWKDLTLQAGSCATWPEDSGRNNLPTWNNLSFWKVSLLNHHFGMKFDWPEFIRHRCCTWDFRYIKNHWYALSLALNKVPSFSR